MENFFQPTDNIEWKSMDHIPGNKNSFYGVLNGARPMGMVKLGPGGYFKLHWHAESEHYLIISGHGRFTVGTEERDIVVNKVKRKFEIYLGCPRFSRVNGFQFSL